jgi:hypothetical protein
MDYTIVTDQAIANRILTLKGAGTFGKGKGGFPIVCSFTGRVFDPCNNPTDAWPIIEELWDKLTKLAVYDYNLGNEVTEWHEVTSVESYAPQ